MPVLLLGKPRISHQEAIEPNTAMVTLDHDLELPLGQLEAFTRR